MKQTKRSITYDKSDNDALLKLAVAEGCTVVALIRRAIKRLLHSEKK